MIRVFPDAAAMNREAADLFVYQARLSITDRGRFAVALSGGSTPKGLYKLLADPPFRNSVDWEKTHVFWGDERCVPKDDERRNAMMARRALLDHISIPPDQIHPILCHQDPKRSADRYEELLRHFFPDGLPVFDLILLGLGENGHTASLFPQTPILENHTALTAAVYVGEQDMHRVTLMPAVINQARLVIFLVSGESKAAILKAVLTGPQNPRRLPAQLVRPRNGDLIWFADSAAAALLENTPADGKHHPENS